MKTPSSNSVIPSNPMVAGQRLVVRLVVPGRLPSWNALLAMEHWARLKYKQQLANSFLSALRVSASDCSTLTTSARNTMWTAAATLDSYQQTRLMQRKLKSDNARQAKASRKKPS